MNFLAHIHLSGDDHELMVGNFIADGIRGYPIHVFSERIQSGIQLHRSIDDFTDHHPMWKQSKNRLFGKYGHYSAVLVDLFYDHFLAAKWNDYHSVELKDYVQNTYDILDQYHEVFPPKMKKLLPPMKQYNWLLNYGNFDGLQQVLNGMSYRAKFESKMEEAMVELKRHYVEFSREFREFYPELQSHVAEVKHKIIKDESQPRETS